MTENFSAWITSESAKKKFAEGGAADVGVFLNAIKWKKEEENNLVKEKSEKEEKEEGEMDDSSEEM